MTKPSEPRSNNRDRVILFGMGAVALLLTLLAINSTRSALDQVPSLQYQRHTDSIEEGLRQASTSRSQAAKRARWLAICGHEFEQALLKSDLSDVPSKQASGMLDVLKNEGADLASVYTLGFRLLAMERAGATAEEKYRTLGPQIRALQKLTFSHGQQELYEFWKQVFLSAGLDDQVASMESLAQIRFPHNAWLVFMDRQLAGMAAALNAEDAEAVKKLHLNLLIMMLIEPAPVGLRAVAARQLGESDLLPTELAERLQALYGRMYTDTRERDSQVSLNGDALGGDQLDQPYLSVLGRLMVLAIVLILVGLVTMLLGGYSLWKSRQAPLGIGPAFLAAIPILVSIWLVSSAAYANVMSINIHRPDFDWNDAATWWRLPWQPFVMLMGGLLCTAIVYRVWSFRHTRGIAIATVAWLFLSLSWVEQYYFTYASIYSRWCHAQQQGVQAYLGIDPPAVDEQLRTALTALLK